jgi:methylated-DNA-[protein]-cysteine S-methyltransferase
MKYISFYSYKICNLGIAEEDGTICRILFANSKTPGGFEKAETHLIKKAASQFGGYFDGKIKNFDLPIMLHGTDFQIAVWKALQNIPYGETISYGKLAAITGNPKASRAVGMANHRNPIPIIIPCHRVIGSNGNLTGYAGGLELKRKLLELEQL